jgi:hypothetical protein
MKQQMKEPEVESDLMKSDYQRMLNEKNSRLTSALPELVDLLNSIVRKRPSLGTKFNLHVKWWWTGRMQQRWARRREVLGEGFQKVRERRVETYTTIH